MLSALLAGALILAAALILGAAVMTLAGRPRHSAVGPAAGVSALLVICGIAVKLPGHAVTAAVAVGVALIAAFVIFDRGTAPTWSVRVGAIAAVLGAALLAALPYLASGRIGILGQGLINDDWASHLLFTEWLDSHAGPTPDLIKDGYPLGPHAIVAASTKVTGASLLEGFAGLTGAIAALLALTPRRFWSPARTWRRHISRRERSRSRCWRSPFSVSPSPCRRFGHSGRAPQVPIPMDIDPLAPAIAIAIGPP
jgi:hypothetical protein